MSSGRQAAAATGENNNSSNFEQQAATTNSQRSFSFNSVPPLNRSVSSGVPAVKADPISPSSSSPAKLVPPLIISPGGSRMDNNGLSTAKRNPQLSLSSLGSNPLPPPSHFLSPSNIPLSGTPMSELGGDDKMDLSRDKDKEKDGGSSEKGNNNVKGKAQQSGATGAGGGASDFVKKLYKMLEEDSYKGIVTWGSKGDSFIVKDMNDFTKIILPSHFKHSNFASFVRQLNKYDFHKVKNPEGQADAPGENYWEFKHPAFTADQKHSLENIKRKITSNKKPETPTTGAPPLLGPGSHNTIHMSAGEDIGSLHRQIGSLIQNQRQMEQNMDRFTAQYQALMADFLGQHRAIAAQDAFTASMLQYMINLECRVLSIVNPAEQPSFPPSSEAQQLMATYSEISRSRYDKMTETTRRAEQLGLMVNGHRRPNSPLQPLGGAGNQHAAGLSYHQQPPHLQQPPHQQQQGSGGHMQTLPNQSSWDSRTTQHSSPEFPNNGLPQSASATYRHDQQGYESLQQQQQQHQRHPSHQLQHQHSYSLPSSSQQQTHHQAAGYGTHLQPQQQQQQGHQAPHLAHQSASYLHPLQAAQHTPLQHPQQQQAQQQFSYFPSSAPSHLRDNRTDSPSSTSESGASYANNVGEGRLVNSQDGMQPTFGHSGTAGIGSHQQQQQSLSASSHHLPLPTPTHAHSEPQMDYFPVPGSGPIMTTPAITPGAVMISTLHTGNNYSSREASQGDDGEITPDLAGTQSITQQNTATNKNISYPLEGEDIAAFAAALKGGQSSAAVRSALTSQPLLVRRATYIPGWSVPPRVLLVEDDAVCRNLTTKFLQLFGCTIDVAADGVEAVNKMQSGVYDICMMDVSMPNLDGVSATSLIRQFDAMTPIISMTGNSRPDEILTYFSHGMNDVLPKPFTKEGMLSMLEKHLIHLKQIHQNPEMAPNAVQLENLDVDNFDPNNNPFFGFGLSNDEYQNILNGLGKTGFTPSPTPTANPNAAGTHLQHFAGKRSQDDDFRDSVKRTRFQEV